MFSYALTFYLLNKELFFIMFEIMNLKNDEVDLNNLFFGFFLNLIQFYFVF